MNASKYSAWMMIGLAGSATLAWAQPSSALPVRSRLVPIAVSGDAAPGLNGASFESFGEPRPIKGGGVVLWARVGGGNATDLNDEAIWLWTPGSLLPRVREGDPIDWLFGGSSTLVALTGTSVTDEGELAFHGAVADLGIPDPGDRAMNAGLFRVAPGGAVSTLLAIGQDTPPPLSPDWTAGVPQPVRQFRSGQAGFVSQIESAFALGSAWWDASGTTPVVRSFTGDPTPPLNGDLPRSFDPPMLDGSGGSVSRVLLDSSTPTSQQFALLRAQGASFSTAVRTGDSSAPITGSFLDFSREPALDASGSLLFHARIQTPSLRTGIWREAGFGPDPIAIEGTPAPGIAGGTLARISDALAVNAAGEGVFHALVDLGAGASQEVLFKIDRNTVTPLIRSGDPLFAADGQVRLRSLGRPTIDSAGRVWFNAWLEGSDVSPTNNRAVVVVPSAGRAEAFAREDQVIPITPDGSDNRVIRTIEFVPIDERDGQSQRAGDGRVVLAATFRDGSAAVLVGTRCGADLTTSDDPLDEGFGIPDGTADAEDFFFFLDAIVAGQTSVCDFTGSDSPVDPSFGVPNGTCDGADFFYYLDLFGALCR